MRKWIFMGVAAFVGIVLALILVPRPNTGGGVADYERVVPDPIALGAPSPAGVVGAKAGPEPTTEGRFSRTGDAPAVPDADRNHEPHEMAREGVERRNQPDALTAGRASAPWSLVRRQILRNDDDFSKEVMAESAEIIADLRRLRRDPDSVDFDTLEQRQLALAAKIRASELGKADEIGGALDRLDEILASYHEQTNTPAP